MSLHPCFRRRWLLHVCLGKAFHAFVDISVFLWLRTKILPRLAQGLFSNERTWQNHWSYCPHEWKMEKAECQHAPICAIPCQHGPTLQFVSCAEKDSLSGTVMMAWIWHVWINAMVFVPMAQAPPEADAKEVLYSLQSKFDRWVYILVFAEGDCCRFAYGKLSHRSMPLWTSVFCCRCASNSQDSPKASPRKNFIEQLKLLLKWMLMEGGEGPVCWVQCDNMWQDCSLTAVQMRSRRFLILICVH